MKNGTIKNEIDRELAQMTFNQTMQKKVLSSKRRTISQKFLRYAAVFAAVILLSGTTAFAGYHILNKVNVNNSTLPELDTMKVINYKPLTAETDANGMIEESLVDYDVIESQMGISLLDSSLADNSFAQTKITTDNKDFAIITVDNYIIGDTYDYNYLPDENRYEYKSGSIYYSPVSLTVDIILSDSQLKNGWDTDYLGMYEYVESYTSAQGYKVNVIQDTTDADNVQNYVSEKCVVFVADGIRYTLKGRTSLETMKEIVDSMDY